MLEMARHILRSACNVPQCPGVGDYVGIKHFLIGKQDGIVYASLHNVYDMFKLSS